MGPGRPLLRPVSARAKPGRSSPHFPPPLVAPVKLEAGCSVPAARRRRRRRRRCLTVGPVFRQSDRSQPARPEKPGNRRCAAHTSPSQHLHPSLRLSVFREATLVLRLFILPSLESPSPTFPSPFRSPLCVSLGPTSPAPTSTLLPLSLILSCLPLCLSLPQPLRFNKSPEGTGGRKQGGFKNIYGFIYKEPRYCPVLNPGEMIYFLPMCGTDPRGVTQRRTGLVPRNLRWLQRLIKEEWINLEHDINNMTLTTLLKPVLLSINSRPRSRSVPLHPAPCCRPLAPEY